MSRPWFLHRIDPANDKLGITSLSAVMQWVSCRTMMKALLLKASCSLTEILLSVSPSVFSWIMLGRGSSSAAFLLPRPEKGVVWPITRWTHLAQVAVVALMVTYLVSISRNVTTGRATWRHLSSSPEMTGLHRELRLWCFYLLGHHQARWLHCQFIDLKTIRLHYWNLPQQPGRPYYQFISSCYDRDFSRTFDLPATKWTH